MQSHNLKYLYGVSCKTKVWILAFIWISGLLSGSAIFHFSKAYITPLMRIASESSVSIVWLVTSNFFPLLCSAFAVYFSIPVIAELSIFVRAASFGFIILGLLFVFGSGGWLVSLWFLFSSFAINFLLLWLYLSLDHINLHGFLNNLAISGAIILFITVMDYLYISPFGASIWEYF